mmetsp:Transcript_5755/g.25937  ORF Transcript_5755/g.25937 Transcript_5755/m.25937 type:complete len:235 (-) Transcript_5755:2885-3589(-)
MTAWMSPRWKGTLPRRRGRTTSPWGRRRGPWRLRAGPFVSSPRVGTWTWHPRRGFPPCSRRSAGDSAARVWRPSAPSSWDPTRAFVARSRGERERRRLRPSRFWFLGAAGPAAAGEGRRAGAAAGRPSHSPPCSRHPARGYRRHLWTARRRRRVRRGRRGSPSSAPQRASPPLPTLRSRGCACSVARTFSRVHSAARREAGAGVPRALCPRRPRPSCRSWRARRGRRRPCSAAG